MQRRAATGLSHVVAALFGALLPLSLAPMNWWVIGLVCTACLCVLLRGVGPRRAFTLALAYGTAMFCTGATWVYVSIHEYGQAPWLLAGLLTGLFIIALALIFALPFSVYGLLNNDHPNTVLLAFPGVWVLGEWLRGWILTGFPWLYLGYGHIDTWLSGWAPLFGVLAVSGFTAYSGALLALVWERKKFRTAIGRGLFVGILIWGGGFYLSTKQWTSPQRDPLSVALVQPNQPLLEKWMPDLLDSLLADFSETTAEHWDKDLIIWPEAGIARPKNDIEPFLESVDAQAREHDTVVITGIPTYESGPEGRSYYNSVIPLGNASGAYDKRHLVPFGEYVPFEQWLRGLITFFDLPMSNFQPGPPQQPPITGGRVKIATVICYEVAYQALLADNAAAANLLLTVSNDTWFGNSLGPHQHLQIAQMRALENGKPMLRATNDGITAAIDEKGNILALLPRFRAGVLSTQVQPYSGATPFNQLGGSPAIIVSLVLCLLSIFAAPRKPNAAKLIS